MIWGIFIGVIIELKLPNSHHKYLYEKIRTVLPFYIVLGHFHWTENRLSLQAELFTSYT